MCVLGTQWTQLYSLLQEWRKKYGFISFYFQHDQHGQVSTSLLSPFLSLIFSLTLPFSLSSVPSLSRSPLSSFLSLSLSLFRLFPHSFFHLSHASPPLSSACAVITHLQLQVSPEHLSSPSPPPHLHPLLSSLLPL